MLAGLDKAADAVARVLQALICPAANNRIMVITADFMAGNIDGQTALVLLDEHGITSFVYDMSEMFRKKAIKRLRAYVLPHSTINGGQIPKSGIHLHN